MSSPKSIHEILRAALTDAAAALAVPLFWEGEVFTPPMGPHLVAQVVIDRAEAASLGKNGLTRTDGALVVKCAVVAGQGDAEAVDLSRQVSAKFKRGTGFEVGGVKPPLEKDGGELVITTPVAGVAASDGRRLSVPLKIPFYAITREG